MKGTPTDVSDVMTRKVVALRTGAVFKDIVRTMQEWRVSALPVLDDRGHVVGVVSEADLLPKEEYSEGATGRYGQEGRKADAVTAGELMTAPAVTVTPDATNSPTPRASWLAEGSSGCRWSAPTEPCRASSAGPDLLSVFLRDDSDIAEDVRHEVVARLFGAHAGAIRIEVRDGVVTLTGRVRETALIPLAAPLARSVAGVDVHCALSGPPRHPDLDPDLPDPQRSAPA